MPNNNISFNSIDDLQHFHTSEEAFMNPSIPSFNEGRMMDSAKFMTEPAKRAAPDVFGAPIVAQNSESLS